MYPKISFSVCRTCFKKPFIEVTLFGWVLVSLASIARLENLQKTKIILIYWYHWEIIPLDAAKLGVKSCKSEPVPMPHMAYQSCYNPHFTPARFGCPCRRQMALQRQAQEVWWSGWHEVLTRNNVNSPSWTTLLILTLLDFLSAIN